MLAVAQSRICRNALPGRVRPILIGLVALCCFLHLATPIAAQVTVNAFMAGARSGNSEKPTSAFTLPTQSASVRDSLDEFQRMVKHEQWEKAFASLEEITKKTTTGFIDRGDNVLVPSRLLVRGLMTSLPGPGRVAYRLFYDSEAMQLMDEASGKQEVDRLSAIVADHMISSVGDTAADRLGDLQFERGNFEQAAAAWQSILTFCPDSKIPQSQTLVKLATALARSNRWNEFREVEQTVRERYAGDNVEIGGRNVTAAEQIAHLATTAEKSVPKSRAKLPADFALPSTNEPLWRFGFRTEPPVVPGVPAAGNPFQLVDIYGRPRANDFVIPSAVDESRLYVNVFGVEMAFDIQTGKLLWRSGKLHLLNLQQARQGAAPERYSINVFGDRVWCVSRDPAQANQQGPFYLTICDAASGKETFSSRRSLSSWSILGAPVLVDGVVYVGAQRNRQGRELSLLLLDAKDGKLVKSVKIGNYAVDQNQVYNDRVARPTLVASGDRLYVDTQAGAVTALNAKTGDMDWAVMYESPPPPTGYYYNYVAPPCGTSGPLLAGGLIFSKGMHSPRLLGLSADGPTVVWNRPVATSSVLVSADDKRIYLGGEELTAYSLETQEMVWATQLPQSVDWNVPLVTENRMYQFTSRGVCEVDKSNGDIVTIFRGDDLESRGGALFVAGGRLITVSNEGITAYSLDKPTAKAPIP